MHCLGWCHISWPLFMVWFCVKSASFCCGRLTTWIPKVLRWHGPSNVHRGKTQYSDGRIRVEDRKINFCMFDICLNFVETATTSAIHIKSFFKVQKRYNEAFVVARASGNMWPSSLEMPKAQENPRWKFTEFRRGKKTPREISGFGCPSKLHQQGDGTAGVVTKRDDIFTYFCIFDDWYYVYSLIWSDRKMKKL